jgi:hypothetical protein
MKTITNATFRVALMLLAVMTAQTAWAETTPVSLSVDNDYAEGEEGYYYLNMPQDGLLQLTQTDIAFKLYDDGGKNGNYSSSRYVSTLQIQAPDDCILEITGKIINISQGELYAFDGTQLIDTQLFEFNGSTNVNDIGTYKTNLNNLLVKFFGNGYSYPGFELTVRVKPAPSFNITLTQLDGGTWAVEGGGTTSMYNKTVTLTFSPENNRAVSTVKVVKTEDMTTEVQISKQSDTQYVFTMPLYDVTVVPDPYDWMWISNHTTCRFSVDGTFKVSANEGTDGAMADYPTVSPPWQSYITNNQITRLVIDPSVTVIGQYAFMYLKLSEVSLPEGLQKIHTEAFRYADITKITIPTTMTNISTYAFYCCDHLDDIYCFAPAAQLTWGGSAWDFIHGTEGYLYATKMHVHPDQLDAYNKKFGSKLNVTIEGDLVATDSWTDAGNYADSFSDEQSDIISITNEAELARLAYLVNVERKTFTGYTFILTKDLNMRRHKWIPIGDSNIPFKGTFEGDGHTISGIEVYQNQNVWYSGLFGYVGGLDDSTPVGTIQNLRLMSSSINGSSCTGGIAGYLNYGTLTNCFTDAIVNGGTNTGGLVGFMHGYNDQQCSVVTDCLYLGSRVSGSQPTSAIVGGYEGTVTIKAYYTNPDMEGKTSNDVLGVKCDCANISSEKVTLTFGNEGKIVYDDDSYYATDGSATFTVAPAADYFQISVVTINNRVLGDDAGTYPLELLNDETTCTIFADADLLLFDNASNATAISQCNEKTYNVILSGRTLYTDGTWNTLCLPFDLTSNDASRLFRYKDLMTLDNSENSGTGFDAATGTLTLNFKEAMDIKAGKPYIIRWEKPANYVAYDGTNATTTSDMVNPAFPQVEIKNVEANVETEYVDFVGTFSPYPITGQNNTILYLGADNNLYWPNGAMTIGSCRAWFRLLGGLQASEKGESQVRAFNLNFGEETSITDNHYDADNSPSQGWYTLDGLKLNGRPAAKGLYLNNGKKIIIK